MQQRQLGPFSVSAIGLGCMNICHAYGAPVSRAQAEAVLLGALGVAALAGLQLWWVRRAPPAVKVLGMRQMALGLSLVVVTALGVRVA